MSLTICPDCGNEVSTAAVACPKCGRPMSPIVGEERTVIREAVPVAVERDSFPTWIFIPLGILGVVLIFLLFALFRQDSEDQQNLSVNVQTKRPANSNSNAVAKTEPNQITVPPTSADPMVSNVPQTTSNSGTTVTEIPAETVKIDRGNLNIDAKVSDRSGNPKPVKAEKFYLLDKDLDSILSDANIESVNGQTPRNSFAYSIVYSDKYGDTRRKALAEISKHIKYEITTDSDGKAQMKDIKPDSYYLFAITKNSNSFAIWSSQLQVNAGQNILNLSPQPLVEIPEE